MVRAGAKQGVVLYFLRGDFQRVAIQTGTGPVVLSVSEYQVQQCLIAGVPEREYFRSMAMGR